MRRAIVKPKSERVVFVVVICLLIGLVVVATLPGYALPVLQVTETPTQEPTIITVTVVITATPSPTITPTLAQETPTLTPTVTPTAIPLPPGAPAILADIEAEFMTIWPEIGDRQLIYYFSHGTPWQGLVTHSVIPADGVIANADRLLLHPTDSTVNWLDFYPSFPLASRYALRVDTYQGEGGRGFVAHLFIYIGADLWHRAIDYGSGQGNQEWAITDPLR